MLTAVVALLAVASHNRLEMFAVGIPHTSPVAAVVVGRKASTGVVIETESDCT